MITFIFLLFSEMTNVRYVSMRFFFHVYGASVN